MGKFCVIGAFQPCARSFASRKNSNS